MSLYYEDGGLRLFHGSNKDILPTFADEAFDSIVTDPPYELGFMGKGWDSSGIAYDVEVWRECFRVLKPGGYMLSFGGTRTWHRIAVAIEDAGFEVRDSIAWMYGSGFPKSMNVARAVDTHVRFGGSSQTQQRKRDMGEDYTPHPLAGTTGFGDGNLRKGAGGDTGGVATEVQTDEARAWEGWGTALKPAFEPIIVARKPLAGTVAANVLVHGTGAINIDACRVPSSESTRRKRTTTDFGMVNDDGWVPTPGENGSDSGRFPSNVLLDESQAAALDAQTGVLSSGTMRAGTRRQSRGGEIYGKDAENVVSGDTYGDSGGASRFFPTFRYEAKAPGSERPEVDGVAHATVKPLDLMRWLVRLVTRRGGHVLDPFAGSGTTGEAALLEGMESTLIELESDHLPLILARVKKPLQPSMFGDWEEEAS